MKSASARRASAVLATVTAAALIALTSAGAAHAGTCPAGKHWNDIGSGVGYCSPNASGGGTGGSGVSDGGGGNSEPVPGPSAPVYTPPPALIYAPVPGSTPPKPKPAATGATKVGSVLKADKYSWAKGAVAKYRWLRNGVPISGATSATYKVRTADRGKKVTVRVTGSKVGRTTSKVGRAYNVR